MSDVGPDEDRSCPSSVGAPGARLFGVVGDDGRVATVRPAPVIDAAFVEKARRHGPLEQRFRFAGPCLRSGCGQWTGSGCGVIARIMADIEPDPRNAAPPVRPCPIRPTCRWFHERGAAACGPCRLVVTESDRVGSPEPRLSRPPRAASGQNGTEFAAVTKRATTFLVPALSKAMVSLSPSTSVTVP